MTFIKYFSWLNCLCGWWVQSCENLKKNQQTAAPLRKTKFTYIVYDHSKLQSFVINFLIKIIVINMQGKLSYFFFRPAGVKLIKPWKYLCNVPGITLIYCTPNILTVVFFFFGWYQKLVSLLKARLVTKFMLEFYNFSSLAVKKLTDDWNSTPGLAMRVSSNL